MDIAYKVYSIAYCFVSVNILDQFNRTISRARQDANNVICLDTNRQPREITYELVGCPSDGYFSTNQSIEGVCYEDMENMRNLLLRPSNMVTGLHSFICLPGGSSSLYSYAIVRKPNNAYNDTH